MIAEPDKIDAMLEDEDSVLSFARIEWYVYKPAYVAISVAICLHYYPPTVTILFMVAGLMILTTY